MRKITQQIANAFKQGKSKSNGNTWTNGKLVFLHTNQIVERDENGDIYMSLAGWNTPTTRERLNGIASILGLNASFTQKNFEPYFNGKLIGSHDWIKVS